MNGLLHTLRHHRVVRMFSKRSPLLRSVAARLEEGSATAGGGNRSLRRVVTIDPARSFEIFQAAYFDSLRWRYKPNLDLVDPEGRLLFRINAHGLKGEEVDPSRRLVVMWGDSVVWGAGRGWVEGLDALVPGHQFLNGGIEGAPLELICEHALERNRTLTVSHNVLFPGWHTMRWPRRVRSLLEQAVEALPGPILATMPTSLGETTASRDLSSYLSSSTEPGFNQNDDAVREFLRGQYYFWAGLPYSVRNARRLLARVKRQNGVVRELARRHDLPLVDLYERMYVDDPARFREDFFDAGHFRMESYPKVQRIVAEELRRVL